MICIGLTGGIGSGKSTVRNMFESLDIPCLDTDKTAKQVVEPNSEGLNQLQAKLGDEILDHQGGLNRSKLREIIFNDANAKSLVESILHPLIRQQILKSIEQFSQLNHPVCLIEIPLLFETQPDYISKVIVVDCEIETQVNRTQRRSQLSETEIRNIIDKQASRAQRQSIADWIIDSERSLIDMQQQVEKILKALHAL